MVGKEVEITARVGAHKDGPKGPLVEWTILVFTFLNQWILERNRPRTGEIHTVKTIPSANGKFKTVVAEGRLNSPKYQDALVTVTIPGDK